MIEVESHGPVRELRLARPPVNALDPGLVSALTAALSTAAREAEGIVLSGQPGMFSAGLDLKALLALDREQMGGFWRDFFRLLETIAACPVPVVAAITGHSPAGGAVLALHCDYRVAAEGNFKIGLNEVQVGLVVPPPIQAAARRLLGAHTAERLMVSGALLTPGEALEAGFVDEVVAADEAVPRAVEKLGALLALPRHAMAETRAMVRRDLAQPYREADEAAIAGMLEGWFADSTQARLRAVLAQLGRKRG